MKKLKQFLSLDNCCLRKEYKDDLRRDRKLEEYKNLY